MHESGGGATLALTIAPEAAAKAAEIVRGRGGAGLRLFAAGGIGGPKYGLAVAQRVSEGDLVVEAPGVRVVVDIGSAEWLAGSELGYVEDGERTGFTILNPLGLHACGGGV